MLHALERTRMRTVAATVGILLVVAVLVAVSATPARAAVFTNPATITIPNSGQATPYPSTINVAGLSGNTTDVNVTLNGWTHTFPDDVDILLVSPTGQRVILTADNGGGFDVSNVTLTLDDAAATFLPDSNQIVSGTFRPTTAAGGGGFNGTPPAPAPPYSTVLSSFNGQSPIGNWSLFVFDDAGGDTGQIAGGWSLEITTTAPTITSFAPTSGTPGTSVVITGTNFSGATTVRFGGVSAPVFVENSATQITATVPAGAITGPISVTTPQGTGTSAMNFVVTASAPTIQSFNPASGKVGDLVTIAGTNLTGASSVRFNGVGAVINSNSDTQIVAVVPPLASTGPIEVTTAGGTATSVGDFVVRHARTITLNAGGNKARGKVSVTDAFTACAANQTVLVQRRNANGRFVAFGTDGTSGTGNYAVPGLIPGAYRAIAKAFTLPSGDVCLKAKSSVSVH